jgi:hypothetical protein
MVTSQYKEPVAALKTESFEESKGMMKEEVEQKGMPRNNFRKWIMCDIYSLKSCTVVFCSLTS